MVRELPPGSKADSAEAFYSMLRFARFGRPHFV